MANAINTNISSLNAQNNLNRTQNALANTIQKLSSGLRINSSRDDAAGLAISERFTNQINGLDIGSRNANDGISLLQTGDGLAAQISINLQRLSILATQASNGTLNSGDRSAINNEFSALITQIGKIASNGNFNGINLLTGSANVTIQTGTGSNDVQSFSIASLTLSALGISGLAVSGATISQAASALAQITTALNTVSDARSKIGSNLNILANIVQVNAVTSTNLSAANSSIKDVDIASETAKLTQLSVLQQAGLAVLSQANSQPQSLLRLLQG